MPTRDLQTVLEKVCAFDGYYAMSQWPGGAREGVVTSISTVSPS